MYHIYPLSCQPTIRLCVLFMTKDKGAHMRDFLGVIPLDKLVIETDAPYLGFR